MDARIRELLPILRCPRTHGALHFSEGRLISEGGEQYPIIDGKPILVRWPQTHHLTPPASAHISQNQARYVVEERCSVSRGRCLHLGSGNVPCGDPRVISFDVLPCENVDVVGEAEDGLCVPERVAELKPQVVVMDLMLPRLGGVDALKI